MERTEIGPVAGTGQSDVGISGELKTLVPSEVVVIVYMKIQEHGEG